MSRHRRIVELETSPAVVRAAERAVELAGQSGREQPSLADWLVALLEDEDGRPFELVEKCQRSPAELQQLLRQTEWADQPAPPRQPLFDAARELAIRWTGDPTLTTTFLFLSLVRSHGPLQEALADWGVDSEELLKAQKSAAIADTEQTEIDGLDSEPAFEIPEAEPEVPTDEPADELLTESVPAEMRGADDLAIVGRILDVNLNRARESLRVLDDYARFALNHAGLTEWIKTIRHRLVSISELLPGELLLLSRNTPGDVGTRITAGNEMSRLSTNEVAQINCKRLQEALRSLEEYGKILDAEFAQEVERLRYLSYEIEGRLDRTTAGTARLEKARLYFLATASQCRHGLIPTIEKALAGGVDIVQLREKQLSDRQLLESARQVADVVQWAGKLFIINDRPDITAMVNADGVHLGQDDCDVAAARAIVGPNRLIGLSTHSIEQVEAGNSAGVDYIGIGPTFPSSTKQFDHFPGLQFVREALAVTTKPAFALGGVNRSRLPDLVKVGARRIAVSAAIAEADDPAQAARELRRILDSFRDC